MPSPSTLYLLSMYTQSSSCIDDRCTLFSNLPYYSQLSRGQGDYIKTQSYLLKKTNITTVLILPYCTLKEPERQLGVSHNWIWNIVVTIMVHLFLDSLNCRYSSCISCPIGCCNCPVDPFIHLGYIIGYVCCSPSVLIVNRIRELIRKKTTTSYLNC